MAWTVVAALIRQCLPTETLTDAMESRLTTLLDNSSRDAEELESLLQDIAAASETTTFVIDGFDECDRTDRLLILNLLQRLVASSRAVIKIFLSSCDDVIADITRRFPTCHEAHMDCVEARIDIKSCVSAAVEQCIESGELVVDNPQLKLDIRDALFKGASGM